MQPVGGRILEPGRGSTSRHSGTATLLAVTLVAALTATGTPVNAVEAAPAAVTAAGETTPVGHSGDAADDPAVWLHPDDPARSVVIGTDKRGALSVYDLDGTRLSGDDSFRPGNVDVRYGFPLAGGPADLVVASDRSRNALAVFTIDPSTRRLTRLATHPVGIPIYGVCLARSPAGTSTRFFAYATGGGKVEQWELFPEGGGVGARSVRLLPLGTATEGCTADDDGGRLYVAEEDTGIWEYSVDPGGGTARTLVDGVGRGCLKADVEGLAWYPPRAGAGGYLIASSQGNDRFCVYRPDRSGVLGSFRVEGGTVDGVSGTDGIEVVPGALGPAFPQGLFVAQDHENPGGRQNFKLVSWQEIARSLNLAP